jgi:hypothetical protein
MFQFYHDFLISYIDPVNLEMISMDTDSYYFGISSSVCDNLILDTKKILDLLEQNHSWKEINKMLDCNLKYHPLRKIIRTKKLEQFDNCIWGHCYDGWEPNASEHYLCRQCCCEHFLFDQRTQGLFKLEQHGDEMVGLASKTYSLICHNKAEKIGCKGVNKTILKQTVERVTDCMKQTLTTKNPFKTKNRGFRVHQGKMQTYEQTKVGCSFLYTKRRVHKDLIHSSPLNMVLSPPEQNLPLQKQKDMLQRPTKEKESSDIESDIADDLTGDDEVRREMGLIGHTSHHVSTSDSEGEDLNIGDGFFL